MAERCKIGGVYNPPRFYYLIEPTHMNQTDIHQQTAQRRIKEFERKFGRNTLHLAYHAALPVALNSELVHLLRINFFLDSPSPLPYMAEIELLLSGLCQEIGEDLYEIEKAVRNELLKGLVTEYGYERLRKVAALLWQYTERQAATPDIRLERAQQLTALNVLEPERARAWLEEAEDSVMNLGAEERQWVVAMRQEVEQGAYHCNMVV